MTQTDFTISIHKHNKISVLIAIVHVLELQTRFDKPLKHGPFLDNSPRAIAKVQRVFRHKYLSSCKIKQETIQKSNDKPFLVKLQ
jgi:hypothetical protein